MMIFLERSSVFAKENKITHAVVVSAIGSAKEVVFRDLLAGVKIPLDPSKTNELRMMVPMKFYRLRGTFFRWIMN